MFPSGYFPSSYFPPSYFPKGPTGIPSVKGKVKGVGGLRHYMIDQMMADRLGQRSITELRGLAFRIAKQKLEYQLLEKFMQRKKTVAAIYTTLLAEI